MALGDVVAAALQTGRFVYGMPCMWVILGGAALGLLPATLGRLCSSAFYALGDTRTPFRYAVVHVGLAAVLGYLFAIPLVSWLGLEAKLGAAGLTVSASLAAWVELLLLRRSLNARVGPTGLTVGYLATLWGAAGAAAVAAWGLTLRRSIRCLWRSRAGRVRTDPRRRSRCMCRSHGPSRASRGDQRLTNRGVDL
jgi:putative peptidoglycan lipid II flippase